MCEAQKHKTNVRSVRSMATPLLCCVLRNALPLSHTPPLSHTLSLSLSPLPPLTRATPPECLVRYAAVSVSRPPRTPTLVYIFTHTWWMMFSTQQKICFLNCAHNVSSTHTPLPPPRSSFLHAHAYASYICDDARGFSACVLSPPRFWRTLLCARARVCDGGGGGKQKCAMRCFFF